MWDALPILAPGVVGRDAERQIHSTSGLSTSATTIKRRFS
jgi:hypothetical protein